MANRKDKADDRMEEQIAVDGGKVTKWQIGVGGVK